MKTVKFLKMTLVNRAALFSKLYIQKNLFRKEFWKLVYGWKINLKMFGNISKDNWNVEMSYFTTFQEEI